MNPLGIKAWLSQWGLVLALALAGLGWTAAGVQAVRLARAKAETSDARTALAREEKGRAQDRAATAAAAASAADQYRTQEEKQRAAAQEVINAERKKAAAIAADAVAAAAQHGRLLDAARAAAAAARGCAAPTGTGTAGSSPAAADAGLVLADVLGRMESRGRELAELADRRGLAGETCWAERATVTTQAPAGEGN